MFETINLESAILRLEWKRAAYMALGLSAYDMADFLTDYPSYETEKKVWNLSRDELMRLMLNALRDPQILNGFFEWMEPLDIEGGAA